MEKIMNAVHKLGQYFWISDGIIAAVLCGAIVLLALACRRLWRLLRDAAKDTSW